MGFVSGEGAWLDTEDVINFMLIIFVIFKSRKADNYWSNILTGMTLAALGCNFSQPNTFMRIPLVLLGKYRFNVDFNAKFQYKPHPVHWPQQRDAYLASKDEHLLTGQTQANVALLTLAWRIKLLKISIIRQISL